MANPTLFTTHIAQGLSRLLTQFHGLPNIGGIVRAYLVQAQELEDMVFTLMSERYVSTATGEQLDGLGEIVGEDRADRDDDDYRVAILGRANLNKKNAKIEDLIYLFEQLLPGTLTQVKDGPWIATVRVQPEAALISPLPSPETLDDELQRAKGGGIRAHLIYGLSARSTLFKFAPGTTPVSSSQGLGNAAQTTGGKWAGIVS